MSRCVSFRRASSAWRDAAASVFAILATLLLGIGTAVARPADTTGTVSADVFLTANGAPSPVPAGSDFVMAIAVGNLGPSTATNVTMTAPLPGVMGSFDAPGGWSCVTPAPGDTGNVVCTIASMPPGAGLALFSISSFIRPSTPPTAFSVGVSANSSTSDPVPGNNAMSVPVLVSGGGGSDSDMAVSFTASPSPVPAGSNITYAITVANNGPLATSNASLTFEMNTPTVFTSMVPPAGWSCVPPPPGSGLVACNAAKFAVGSAMFTAIGSVPAGAGAMVTATASVNSNNVDVNTANNTATVATGVLGGAAPVELPAAGNVAFGAMVLMLVFAATRRMRRPVRR